MKTFLIKYSILKPQYKQFLAKELKKVLFIELNIFSF